MEIDIGQGSNSVLAMTVAEVRGIEPDDVQLIVSDTDTTPIDLGSYSSRVTFMMGNAAKQAAERIRAMLVEAAGAKLEVPADELILAERKIYHAPTGRSLSFREAVPLAEALHGQLTATGSYTPPKLSGPYKGSGVGPSPAYSYSAAVVLVDVDPEMGIVTPERVWLAHDVGRAINPTLVEGQVEGSVYMALGEIFMEEQVFRKGLHKDPSMLEYKSPTFLEMPPVETFIVESIDGEGPFGAKEVGQGPLLPMPPAVANALYDAVGARIDELPITPEKVLRGLDLLKQGETARIGPPGIPAVDWVAPIRVDPVWYGQPPEAFVPTVRRPEAP